MPFSGGEIVKDAWRQLQMLHFLTETSFLKLIKIYCWIEKVSNNEECLKMNATNLQWFSIAVDNNTIVSDRAHTACCFWSQNQTDMDFSITEELAILMPMKRTTTDADIYKVKKVLHSLDIPIQKLSWNRSQIDNMPLLDTPRNSLWCNLSMEMLSILWQFIG